MGITLALATGWAGVLGAIDAPAARADSTQMTAYQGIHPLSPHQGAFCYIDAPHLHRVPPPDTRVYVQLKDGAFVFVGDPVALGYDGPKVAYFGPHVLTVADVPAADRLFCYITGPHYHAVGPGESPAFVLKDGVYWYKGDAPPVDRVRAWVNEVHPIKGYVPPKADLAAAPPDYHPFVVTDQPPPPPPPVAAPAGGKAGAAKNGKPTDKKGGAAPAAKPAAPAARPPFVAPAIKPAAAGGAR